MPLSMPPKKSYQGCELEPKIVESPLCFCIDAEGSRAYRTPRKPKKQLKSFATWWRGNCKQTRKRTNKHSSEAPSP